MNLKFAIFEHHNYYRVQEEVNAHIAAEARVHRSVVRVGSGVKGKDNETYWVEIWTSDGPADPIKNIQF